MFEILFTTQAKKFLKRVPTQDATRILSALERCRIRPYTHAKKLVASPYFRLRVGSYRLIVDIQQGKLIVLVLEIGHRRNIYK